MSHAWNRRDVLTAAAGLSALALPTPASVAENSLEAIAESFRAAPMCRSAATTGVPA